MKRRMIAAILCLSVGITLFAGCGKDDTKSSSSSSSASSSASTSSSTGSGIEDDGIPVVEGADVVDSVELGNYKGLELTKTVTEVTDEDVESYIEGQYGNTEIKEGACQSGDSVFISYVGKMDGAEFEGGTSEGDSITLGSSGYIDGFDDGVIGMAIGETKDLNLTFPDPYEAKTEFSGKPVVFSVTVKSISRPFPELTEDWVKTYTTYTSIDEYRTSIRKTLEDSAASSDENALKSAAWKQIVEGSKIKQYPKESIDVAQEAFKAQMEYYASMYGMDMETYKEQMGMSGDAYDEYLLYYAKSQVSSQMIIEAIADKEGFTSKDQEYKDVLKRLCEEQGMSEEDLIKQYTQETVDIAVNQERIMDVILASAKITETKAPAEDSAASSSSTAK